MIARVDQRIQLAPDLRRLPFLEALAISVSISSKRRARKLIGAIQIFFGAGRGRIAGHVEIEQAGGVKAAQRGDRIVKNEADRGCRRSLGRIGGDNCRFHNGHRSATGRLLRRTTSGDLGVGLQLQKPVDDLDAGPFEDRAPQRILASSSKLAALSSIIAVTDLPASAASASSFTIGLSSLWCGPELSV